MSWYVERLLRDSESIKSRKEVEFEDIEIGETLLDDDSYDDLLTLEATIKKVCTSELELEIVKLLVDNTDNIVMSKIIDRSTKNTKLLVDKLTDKLALILGNQFTNEGYADYICNKHNYDDYKRISILTYLNGERYVRKTKANL